MREKAEKGWTSAIVRDMSFEDYITYRVYFPRFAAASTSVSSTRCEYGSPGWRMCVYDRGPVRTLCYIHSRRSDTRCITDEITPAALHQ